MIQWFMLGYTLLNVGFVCLAFQVLQSPMDSTRYLEAEKIMGLSIIGVMQGIAYFWLTRDQRREQER
jgi:membrane protein DedA with SNARE-associated domain